MTESLELNIKKALVKKQVCFSQLKDEEVEGLAELLIEKDFAAGETIVNEGDLVDSVYLIHKGEAEVQRIHYENKTPRVEYLATLSDGQAIGLSDTGFYSLSGKRTATVVAKTNVTTLFLSVAKFRGFALAHTHVAEVMNQQVEKL